MMPARPPPPTAWKRPFHAAVSGSQTSNLIAGDTTPAIRQIDGILSGCGAGAPGAPPPGGVNVLMLSASVILVSGKLSFARSAQPAAEALPAAAKVPAASATASEIVVRFMVLPLVSVSRR